MSLEDLLIDYHRKHVKETLVEEFQDSANASATFYVIDRKAPFLHQFDTRRIEFRSGSTYAYSTIYLDKSRRMQPIYVCVQQMAESFFPNLEHINRALVLGCAGCSIPRFLALSNEQCKITGIEYSKIMVEIAQKHFINDPIFHNFELIQDDAFAYVKNTSDKFNFLFVDLFLAEKNHPQMLSDDFVKDVSFLTAEESISVFNLLSLSKEACIQFAMRHLGRFTAAYVFDEMFHYYVVFVKTAKSSNLKAFEGKITKYVRMQERFVNPIDSP